jgi:CHAT domain-containing protein/Tfp pilus assembly protein PilF
MRIALFAFTLCALSGPGALAQDADREHARSLMASGTTLSAQKTPDAYHKAAASFEEAAELWGRLGDRQQQINAYYGAAWAHFPLHELREMSGALEKAQAVAGPDADPRVSANLLVSFSVLHNERGEYPLSIDELRKARDLYSRVQDEASERQVTSFLAGAYRMQGLAQEKANDTVAAVDSHERAAALFQEAGDAERSGASLIHLGQMSEQIPTPEAWEKAASRFTQAIPLLESAGDRAGQANAWWGLGSVYDSLGRSEQSRDAYLKVLPFLSDLKNERAEGLILKNLAGEEDNLKRFSEAVGYYQRSLPLLTAAHDTVNQYLAGMKLGADLEALGKAEEALQTYGNTAIVCRDAGAKEDEAVAFSRIALLQMGARHWQEALDALGEQQKLYAGLGDRASESMTWSQIGSVHQLRGEYSQKLKADMRALALLEDGPAESVDPARREAALRSVGDSYSGQHNGPEALTYLERALAMNPGNANEKALLLVEIGEVHYQMSRYDEALRFENQALDIESTRGEAAFTERISNSIALTLQAVGETEKAKDIFQRNLVQARERHDIQHQVTGLQNLGRLYQDSGDIREAERLYDESLRLARSDQELEQAANTLGTLGMVYYAEGREDEALGTLNEALTGETSLGNTNGESVALNNLALVYGYTGQPQKALDAQNQALSIMRKSGDSAGIASQLGNLGSLYQQLGDYARAKSYFEQALETYREFNDEAGQALTHNSLGVLAMNSGDAAGALAHFNEALPGARKYGFRARQATILSNKANALIDNGDLEGAEKNEKEALAIAREIHDLDAEALALHGLGSISERLNFPDRALDYMRQARAGWRELRAADAEARADSVMARIEGAKGNLDEGLADVSESIRLLESQRGSLGSEDLRAYYLASLSDPYQTRIDLLMKKHRLQPEMGYDRQAFETSERERARSLIDLLVESRADIRKGADPALLARERALDRSLSAEASQLRSLPSDSSEFKRLQVNIEDLSAERERVDALIRARNPAYAAATRPRPMSLDQIQNQVLGPNTTLLEYSLGADRSFLFRVTGTSFQAFELPKRSEIESAARDFYQEVANYRKGRTEFPNAVALGHILLDPAAEQMKGQRLVIVGDGELWGIPFAALRDPSNGKPLIAGHEVVIEPSASALAIIRQQGAGRKPAARLLATVADPVFGGTDDDRVKNAAPGVGRVAAAEDLKRLEYTRNEARNIRALASHGESLDLVDFGANKTAVAGDRLAGYQIIHFATHGLMDPTHPQLSGLALSMYDEKGEPVDGFLRVNDIFAMKLGARLVVLSACESGQGQLVGAEGLMGLTRGFFFAGAETLVASLWRVDDKVTEETMSRFYREMLRERRRPPAAALRAAQVWMMAQPEWSDPSYWAAFTVQGEWR